MAGTPPNMVSLPPKRATLLLLIRLVKGIAKRQCMLRYHPCGTGNVYSGNALVNHWVRTLACRPGLVMKITSSSCLLERQHRMK